MLGKLSIPRLGKKIGGRPGKLGVHIHGGRLCAVNAWRDRDDRCQATAWEFASADLVALRKQFIDLGLARMPCTLVLDTAQYQLLMSEAAAVPVAELRSAMRWRVKEMVNTPLEDLLVDVFPMPDGRRNARSDSVFVVAAKNSMVNPSSALLRGAGAQMQTIDVADLALRNVLALDAQDADGLMLLYLGADTSTVSIYRQGQFYLSRQLALSQGEARQVMSADLTAQDELFARLTPELRRSMDHYENHYAMPALTRLWVWPGDPALDSFARALAQTLDIQGELMSLETRVQVEQGAELPGFLLALGGALRQDTPAP